MYNQIKLDHIALQFKDKESANNFFIDFLNMNLLKSFNITSTLSKSIFGIDDEVEILVYSNNDVKFEVFISNKTYLSTFNHVCIEVNDKKEFKNHCKKFEIEPIIIDKNGKKLFFIKDFSGNLYEIIEK